jgi:hypothetical protein
VFAARHPDYGKVRSRWYRREHPERTRASTRKWRAKNREVAIAAVKRWTENNRERFRAMVQAWRAKNRSHRNAKARRDNARVRAMLMQRIPAWADFVAIDAIYARCAEVSRTGSPHHVDHVIPLRGQTVSGLHVHTNLQIIPKSANLRKSNTFIGEMM